jgi:hypothetical protein
MNAFANLICLLTELLQHSRPTTCRASMRFVFRQCMTGTGFPGVSGRNGQCESAVKRFYRQKLLQKSTPGFSPGVA